MEYRERIPVVFEFLGVGIVYGELRRILSPRTIEALIKKLPIKSPVNVWGGGEVYFPVDIKRGREKATLEIDAGTIAYWPLGDALCLFYEKIKPYSPVNLLGEVTEGIEVLKKVKRGTTVKFYSISAEKAPT